MEDPYSGIVKIRAEDGEGTGFFIGPNTIVTNRHVLFEGTSSIAGPPRKLTHIQLPSPGIVQYENMRMDGLGRHVSLSYPYHRPSNFAHAMDSVIAGDVAVLHLERPPGSPYIFSVDGPSPSPVPGQPVFSAGYPENAGQFTAGLQYPHHRGLVVSPGYHVAYTPSVTDRRLPGTNSYSYYGSGGMSGAPVYTIGPDGRPQLVGIHAGSFKDAPGELPRGTPPERLQTYPEIIDPGGPVMSRAPYGGNAFGPRLNWKMWAWLQDQSRHGGGFR